MKRGLVVVDDSTEMLDLGKEAGEFAAGVDAELHVVRFVDEAEYQGRLQRAATGNREIESMQEAVSVATELVQSFASDAFEGLDIDVQTEGIVDPMPAAVVDYAEEHACDHIFVSGQKRSPTGKALFGDVAQSVILDFDGSVTVKTS